METYEKPRMELVDIQDEVITDVEDSEEDNS